MPVTRLEVDGVGLVLTTATEQIQPTDDMVVALFRGLREFHARTPLASMELRPLAGSPDTYRYTFQAVDGREWKQDLRFAPGQPADMNFRGLVDFWILAEFEPHRVVRDLVMGLVSRRGVTEIVWTP